MELTNLRIRIFERLVRLVLVKVASCENKHDDRQSRKSFSQSFGGGQKRSSVSDVRVIGAGEGRACQKRHDFRQHASHTLNHEPPARQTQSYQENINV
jgi:hypothetical protein